MKQRTGQVRDIAKVEADKETRAWNCILIEDDAEVTFAALDRDHAQELTDLINACSWVQVVNSRADER